MIFLTLTFEKNEENEAKTNPRFRLNFFSEGDTFSRSSVDVFEFRNVTGRHFFPPDSYGKQKHFVAVFNPKEDTEYVLVERYFNPGVGSFFHNLWAKPVKGRGVAFELEPRDPDTLFALASKP